MKKVVFALLLALAGAPGALAGPAGILVHFENGPVGAQPQGFTPLGVPGAPNPVVSFHTLNGAAGLEVGDFGPASQGNGLAIGGSADALVMQFSRPLMSLGLVFGNDESGSTQAGDLAVLTLFKAGQKVGQVTQVLNRNGALDQVIQAGGQHFDRVVFAFTDGALNIRAGATETVDDIGFFPVDTLGVPEPATATLLASALVGLAALRRRQRGAARR